MKDLMKYVNECMDELNAIDIPYSKKVEKWEINKRAKNRWGQCRKNYDSYSINISVRLLDDEVTEKALKTTIIHELLHTIEGCMNHGYKWQKYADLVNDCYNYNVKRVTSIEEKGLDKEKEKLKCKYVFKCSNCGAITAQDRLTKFVKHYSSYGCGKCNKYNVWLPYFV